MEFGPELRNKEIAGYFQLFHSKALPPTRPWYSDKFETAGGCDTEFHQRWPVRKRIRLTDFVVLHLGDPFRNWRGIK
jgi:hypothetical protein